MRAMMNIASELRTAVQLQVSMPTYSHLSFLSVIILHGKAQQKKEYLNLSILSLDHINIIRWYRLYTTDPCLHHCSWCSELGAAMSWAFYPAATIYIWNKSIISQPSRLLAAAPSGALQWWILWTVSPLRSLNSSTGIILQYCTLA